MVRLAVRYEGGLYFRSKDGFWHTLDPFFEPNELLKWVLDALVEAGYATLITFLSPTQASPHSA